MISVLGQSSIAILCFTYPIVYILRHLLCLRMSSFSALLQVDSNTSIIMFHFYTLSVVTHFLALKKTA